MAKRETVSLGVPDESPATEVISALESANHNDPANGANQGHGEPVKRTRSKPGENRVLVTLDDFDFADLTAGADGRPINVWLSRLLSGRIATLTDEYNGRK